MLVRSIIAALALTTGSVAAPAETGAWKTVGCDNTRSCTAAAGDSNRSSALALVLTRSGERDATLGIRLAYHHAVDARKEGTATLSAGGRTVAPLRYGHAQGRG